MKLYLFLVDSPRYFLIPIVRATATKIQTKAATYAVTVQEWSWNADYHLKTCVYDVIKDGEERKIPGLIVSGVFGEYEGDVTHLVQDGTLRYKRGRLTERFCGTGYVQLPAVQDHEGSYLFLKNVYGDHSLSPVTGEYMHPVLGPGFAIDSGNFFYHRDDPEGAMWGEAHPRIGRGTSASGILLRDLPEFLLEEGVDIEALVRDGTIKYKRNAASLFIASDKINCQPGYDAE